MSKLTRVFVQSTLKIDSIAMERVAIALAKYSPRTVQIVKRRDFADLVIIHSVSYEEALETISSLHDHQQYGIIQYCFKTSGGSIGDWIGVWLKAKIVWSYYDLTQIASDYVGDKGQCLLTSDPIKFYLSPLGVDEIFTRTYPPVDRDIGVITSGYISNPDAEAIEEVAIAADQVGLTVQHLGPYNVEGMSVIPNGWSATDKGIHDRELVKLYQRSKWVAGLRHHEGFELPIIEGLVSGARPIAFDRPDMLAWYKGNTVFVPECSGQRLIDILVDVFSMPPKSVSDIERDIAISEFSWPKIVRGFWKSLAYDADRPTYDNAGSVSFLA